jgi:hypothetical protein
VDANAGPPPQVHDRSKKFRQKCAIIFPTRRHSYQRLLFSTKTC